MPAPANKITDRAKRYRAQKNVTGQKKCVLCGKGGKLDVMHLTGNEAHGEKENLAYGCRSCNASLGAAFKKLKLGKPTNQYNPAKNRVPTFEQYMWAVSNHTRGAHDSGGAVIHATPKHKRVEYARRILGKAQATKRDKFEDRWNPGADDLGYDPNLDAYGDPKKPLPKGYVKVSGHVVKRGSARHKLLAEQARIDRQNPGNFLVGDGVHMPAAAYWDETEAQEKADTLNEKARRSGRPAVYKVYLQKPSTREGRYFTKRNPADASAGVFEDFHGFKPAEVVTVTKKVHHHEHLASLGTLVSLDVWGVDERGHKITGFKKALLCCNEARNQLFIEGGDQSVDLSDYGIKQVHEFETLGTVTNIGYKTNKTHLGDEGGEAVYVHRFRATNDNGKHVIVKMTREPDLIYDVRNEQLLFSGGSYEILREGINK